MTRLPAPFGFALREAWPGLGNRGQPVHLVDWPTAQACGAALCGRLLADVQLYPAGVARRVRTPLCGPCEAALAARQPPAPVLDLDTARRRRRG